MGIRYSGGQGDLVRRFLKKLVVKSKQVNNPYDYLITLVIPITNQLTKSPDPPSRYPYSDLQNAKHATNMVVSQNSGPQYRPQYYTRTLLTGNRKTLNPKPKTLIRGNPTIDPSYTNSLARMLSKVGKKGATFSKP